MDQRAHTREQGIVESVDFTILLAANKAKTVLSAEKVADEIHKVSFGERQNYHKAILCRIIG